MGNSGKNRDETPKGHTRRKVYRGFPEMIEEHVSVSSRRGSQRSVPSRPWTKDVRGNLHGDISDIKNTKDRGELVSSEAQIFLETT